MSKDDDLVDYQTAQGSAEHYNQMIWIVFSVGVALSILILYKIWIQEISLERWLAKSFIAIFGYCVLIYCVFTLENFRIKKEILHRHQNKKYFEIFHKKHPLDKDTYDRIGTSFFYFSIFLIHFAYIHTFLRIIFSHFTFNLSLPGLILVSLLPSILMAWIYRETIRLVRSKFK